MEQLNRFTDQAREDAERAANDACFSPNNNMSGGFENGSNDTFL